MSTFRSERLDLVPRTAPKHRAYQACFHRADASVKIVAPKVDGSKLADGTDMGVGPSGLQGAVGGAPASRVGDARDDGRLKHWQGAASEAGNVRAAMAVRNPTTPPLLTTRLFAALGRGVRLA
jgi:hypothetical protein